MGFERGGKREGGVLWMMRWDSGGGEGKDGGLDEGLG